MVFKPTASVHRVCDPRWQRFLIRDGAGRYWTGRGFSDAPADALLFIRESDAMRAGGRIHQGGTTELKASLVISVGKGEWAVEDLVAYLKQWGRFVLMKSQETRAVKVEIRWDELEEDDASAG
jgi:hypothetical protein